MDFQKLTIIYDGADHLIHIVWFVGAVGDNFEMCIRDSANAIMYEPKIPNCAAAPINISLGFEINAEKSVIAPIPKKISEYVRLNSVNHYLARICCPRAEAA